MNSFMKFQQISSDFIKSHNRKLTRTIQNYTFSYFSDQTDFKLINPSVLLNIQKSKVVVIDIYQEPNLLKEKSFVFFGFEKTIIITDLINLNDFFQSFLSNLNVTFFPNAKEIFDMHTQAEYKELKIKIFFESIHNLNGHFLKENLASKLRNIDIIHIINCISGYLFTKSYLKSLKDRLNDFDFDAKKIESTEYFNEDDYIELQSIGIGCFFQCILIYMIEREEICIIKKPILNEYEVPKLIERETQNYLQLKHPLVPKFYGKTKHNKNIM